MSFQSRFQQWKPILILIILLLLFSGCKSRKPEAPKRSEIKLNRVDSVFHSMKAAEFEFETLVARFSGIYNFDGTKQNFNGQLRLLNDSLIWCSITVMNIEVARVMVTPDTVKMINRLSRKYFLTDFRYINYNLNTDIDFDMLQALILGNDIPYYETDKFNLEIKPESFVLSTIGRHKLKQYVKTDDDLSKVLVQKIKIDKTTLRIMEQNLKQVRNPNKKVEAIYSNFEDHNGLFPTEITFKFIGVKELILHFNFTKIEKNTEISFPFKIPNSYTLQTF
ncbi:MAG: DUF4292 domain-containing protein [Bacteroidales bacterium]|nr:DUF4292 domain-containing protein [Bacteroidales bacterium]